MSESEEELGKEHPLLTGEESNQEDSESNESKEEDKSNSVSVDIPLNKEESEGESTESGEESEESDDFDEEDPYSTEKKKKNKNKKGEIEINIKENDDEKTSSSRTKSNISELSDIEAEEALRSSDSDQPLIEGEEEKIDDVITNDKWEVAVKINKSGEFYYTVRNIPTIPIICFALFFVISIVVLFLTIPYGSYYVWYVPVIAICVSIFCFLMGIIPFLVLVFKLETIKTLFSDHGQIILVNNQYLCWKKTKKIPYTEAREFFVLRLGEKMGFTNIISRYLVYLKCENGEDIKITGKLRYLTEANKIAYYLNEALISKFHV